MKKIILTYFLTATLIAHFGVQNSFSGIKQQRENVRMQKIIVSDQKSDTKKLSIEAYPNPAEDHIFIKLDNQNSDNAEIEVMSFIGNKMNTSVDKIGSGFYKLNLRNIPSGHYYVLVTNGEQKQIKKFLKN